MTKPSQPEMSTAVAATAMFVEVLVVGIGFFTSLVILAAAVAGSKNITHVEGLAGSNLAAGAALATSYALGILADRVADNLLKRTRRRLRASHFSSDAEYDRARRSVAAFPDVVARADYARSRMRICRGWILNSILLFISVDIALVRFSFTERPLLICLVTVMGISMAVGFYGAWRTITETGYKKLVQQSQQDPVDPALEPSAAVPNGSTQVS